jgi:L-rhamnose mutarotase
MQKVAFKMFLRPGRRDEYRRRHDAIWPELVRLLRESGISDYSIHLDEETNTLFAVLRCADARQLEALPQSALMQRWWRHMADIMETNADGSPRQVALPQMFHLD